MKILCLLLVVMHASVYAADIVATINLDRFPEVEITTKSESKITGVFAGGAAISDGVSLDLIKSLLVGSHVFVHGASANTKHLILVQYKGKLGEDGYHLSRTGWNEYTMNLLLVQLGYVKPSIIDVNDERFELKRKLAIIVDEFRKIPDLIRALRDPKENADVRAEAIRRLSVAGTRASGIIPDLIKLLNDANLRAVSIRALGNLGSGDKSVLLPLVGMLAIEPNLTIDALIKLNGIDENLEQPLIDLIISGNSAYAPAVEALMLLPKLSPEGMARLSEFEKSSDQADVVHEIQKVLHLSKTK